MIVSINGLKAQINVPTADRKHLHTFIEGNNMKYNKSNFNIKNNKPMELIGIVMLVNKRKKEIQFSFANAVRLMHVTYNVTRLFTELFLQKV
jgi:hypothetical protein